MKNINLRAPFPSKRERLVLLSPSAETAPSDALLLSVLLSDCPSLGLKGDKMALAGLDIRVSALYLGGKPSLLLDFDQVDDKSLTYLFKDPFKAADSAFGHLLQFGFEADEAMLDAAKRKVLSTPDSPARRLLSKTKADLAPLPIEREAVLKATLPSLKEAFSAFSRPAGALEIRIGEAKRFLPLDLPSLPEKREPAVADVLLPADCGEEALLLDFYHPEVKTAEDKACYRDSVYALERATSLYFRRMMLPEISYRLHTVSRNRSFLLMTFAENNLSLLRKQVPFRKEKALPFLYDESRADKVWRTKAEIETLIDERKFDETLLFAAVSDMPLEEGEAKPEQVQAFFEKMLVLNLAYATREDKE